MNDQEKYKQLTESLVRAAAIYCQLNDVDLTKYDVSIKMPKDLFQIIVDITPKLN